MPGAVAGMTQQGAPVTSARLGRTPWNSALGAPNGPGAPPQAGPGAGRVRQARTGGSAHPPAPNNGHVARTKHVITDSALKEASAAVERALRPARTVSVPERTHPGPLNLPCCPVHSPSPLPSSPCQRFWEDLSSDPLGMVDVMEGSAFLLQHLGWMCV